MAWDEDSATLLRQAEQDVAQAQKHLAFSLAKIERLKLLDQPAWSEEDLEILEAFSSRFARTADLVLSRYVRLLTRLDDPGFRGTLIDMLRLAEKAGHIGSAKTWYRIRSLRNVAAHDYHADDLRELYLELAQLAPTLLDVLSRAR